VLLALLTAGLAALLIAGFAALLVLILIVTLLGGLALLLIGLLAGLRLILVLLLVFLASRVVLVVVLIVLIGHVILRAVDASPWDQPPVLPIVPAEPESSHGSFVAFRTPAQGRGMHHFAAAAFGRSN
jgi:Zn-dependent protease with chaperone function